MESVPIACASDALSTGLGFCLVRSFRFVTLESRNRIVAVLLVGFCIAVGLVTEVSPSDFEVSGVFATCDSFSHSQSPFSHGAGQDAHNGTLRTLTSDTMCCIHLVSVVLNSRVLFGICLNLALVIAHVVH